jgi:hypothetical protein
VFPQEHETTALPGGTSKFTLRMLDRRLHKSAAENLRKHGRLLRMADYEVIFPATREEYAALNKHAVVLLTIVTQDAAELPLKRVFLRAPGGEEFPLRVEATFYGRNRDSLVRKTFGPFRAEVFCLLPVSRTFEDSTLQVDFAKNRAGFAVTRFPAPPESEFILRDQDRNPPPDHPVSPDALKALLSRELPEFRAPDFSPELPAP